MQWNSKRGHSCLLSLRLLAFHSHHDTELGRKEAKNCHRGNHHTPSPFAKKLNYFCWGEKFQFSVCLIFYLVLEILNCLVLVDSKHFNLFVCLSGSSWSLFNHPGSHLFFNKIFLKDLESFQNFVRIIYQPISLLSFYIISVE